MGCMFYITLELDYTKDKWNLSTILSNYNKSITIGMYKKKKIIIFCKVKFCAYLFNTRSDKYNSLRSSDYYYEQL